MKKMAQEKEFEFVSAAMDDELSEHDIERLLKDENAHAKWYQYHLIRDCMQYKRAVGKDIEYVSDEVFLSKLSAVTQERRSISSNVQNGMKRTPAPVEASNHSFRWFSIAASVMAIGVISWQMLPLSTHDSGGVAVQDTQKSRPADASVVPVSVKTPSLESDSTDVVVPDAAVQNQQGEAEMKSAVQVEKQVLNGEAQRSMDTNKTIIQ